MRKHNHYSDPEPDQGAEKGAFPPRQPVEEEPDATQQAMPAGGPPVVTALAIGAPGSVTLVSRYSYPKSPGDERWSCADAVGPSSYTQVTPGTPPTGGQAIPASAFGLQSLDAVFSTAGGNGTWGVEAILVPATFGDASPGVILLWYVLATGAQVAAAANLSTTFARLLAVGR